MQQGLASSTPIKLNQRYPSRNNFDAVIAGKHTWQYLQDRINAAPSETKDVHATDSPRVFFAAVGPASSGNPTISISNFQCLFLNSVTVDSLTVTYLDSCVTTAPPGSDLSATPPAGSNTRSSLVLRLID